MAEIELNVLTGQCLKRRIDDIKIIRKEARAWQEFRNNRNAKGNWHFITKDAWAKLSRFYPTLDIRAGWNSLFKHQDLLTIPYYCHPAVQYSYHLKQIIQTNSKKKVKYTDERSLF